MKPPHKTRRKGAEKIFMFTSLPPVLFPKGSLTKADGVALFQDPSGWARSRALDLLEAFHVARRNPEYRRAQKRLSTAQAKMDALVLGAAARIARR